MHDVMVWRKFVKLSRSIDEAGWTDSPKIAAVRELEYIAVQTKKLLNALMKSCEENLSVVELEQ